MNILIVLAHPEPQSMNGLMSRKAKEVLTEKGYKVRINDLYAQNFRGASSRADFSGYQGDFFDLQIAQTQAEQRQSYPPHLQAERDKLLWADVVIFQFPLWWYSVPAILKDYIDSLFSVGFAYAGANRLAGKRYMLSFTTGAPEFVWTTDKKGTIEQTLFHLYHGTFPLTGMVKLPHFVGYGSKRLSKGEREELLYNFVKHLEAEI